jgi:hypothetical protein
MTSYILPVLPPSASWVARKSVIGMFRDDGQGTNASPAGLHTRQVLLVEPVGRVLGNARNDEAAIGVST